MFAQVAEIVRDVVRTPPSRLLRAGLVPLAPVLVGGLVMNTAHISEPRLAFFGAASQIIPVLLVVLALEHRYFFRPFALGTMGPARRVENVVYFIYPIILLMVLGLGEYAALEALATGKPDSEAAKTCAGAIAGGFTAACLLPLAPERTPSSRPYDHEVSSH